MMIQLLILESMLNTSLFGLKSYLIANNELDAVPRKGADSKTILI